MVTGGSNVPPMWLVLCAPVVVQILFGLYPVIVKKFAVSTKEKANAYIFTFYRDACAGPVMLLYSLLLERKFLIPDLKMIPVFMVLGLVGMFASQMLYITGVYSVGPDVASALQPAVPVWATIISLLTCTESVGSPFLLHTWTKFIGILLAADLPGSSLHTVNDETWKQEGLALQAIKNWTGGRPGSGAIELALTGDSDNSSAPQNTTASVSTGFHVSNEVLGYASCLGNTLCMACYILLQKRFLKRLRCKWKDYPVGITGYSYLFGSVYMGLACLYFVMVGRSQEFILPSKSLFALVYAIIITSGVCYSLLTWAGKYLYPSVLTAFWPVQVFAAVIFAFIITGDQLAPWQYLGALSLIGGLILVVFSIHMNERLAKGRAVIRLDKCCWEVQPTPPADYDTPLDTPLMAPEEEHETREQS